MFSKYMHILLCGGVYEHHTYSFLCVTERETSTLRKYAREQRLWQWVRKPFMSIGTSFYKGG